MYLIICSYIATARLPLPLVLKKSFTILTASSMPEAGETPRQHSGQCSLECWLYMVRPARRSKQDVYKLFEKAPQSVWEEAPKDREDPKLDYTESPSDPFTSWPRKCGRRCCCCVLGLRQVFTVASVAIAGNQPVRISASIHERPDCKVESLFHVVSDHAYLYGQRVRAIALSLPS